MIRRLICWIFIHDDVEAWSKGVSGLICLRCGRFQVHE